MFTLSFLNEFYLLKLHLINNNIQNLFVYIQLLLLNHFSFYQVYSNRVDCYLFKEYYSLGLKVKLLVKMNVLFIVKPS